MPFPLPPRPADLPEPPLLAQIRAGVIGDGTAMSGPFGPRRVTYCDYTASGRALEFIEAFILDEVLPRYANTHTESSGTGLQTSRLREDARSLIAQAMNADQRWAVIFAGSGSTGAIDRLIGILNLRIPADLDAAWSLSEHIPGDQRPVVFIGPYEHHSNELPWRESIADVVVIGEDADGHVDAAHLEAELHVYAGRPLLIGSFSAASNVTGILTDTHAISDLLHRHGALAFWDFAAAAPYVEIDVAGMCGTHEQAGMDAVFLSPHKFVGGPGTPGILVVRRDLVRNTVPVVVGGGTVAYVNTDEHRYLANVEHREEAGTPAIVESIRAGLVFGLKQAVGIATIRAHEEDYVERAMSSWRANPAIELLGNAAAKRLSIVSFVVHRTDNAGQRSGSYLHHNVVVALLNDLFGIQARGGCSCAGPYGHRLLGIDAERSHAFEREITGGCEGIKPGWVRVNFNYFIDEAVFDYVVAAVHMVATHGHLLLPDYRFDLSSGRWRHHRGPIEPPLRLSQVSYDPATGEMIYPHRDDVLGIEALAGHLQEAQTIIESRLAEVPVGAGQQNEPPHPALLREGLEQLRWFELPEQCLST